MRVDIPGSGLLEISHLVLDYNGTIALDGELLAGVAWRLQLLAREMEIHVITADTFGSVAATTSSLPCTLSVLPPGDQDQAKLAYVEKLGPERSCCMGNGRNDALMLRRAALGVGVLGSEGAAAEILHSADIVVRDIRDGLDLLLNPLRLSATLRV
jgi:soluble P-type ATPase